MTASIERYFSSHIDTTEADVIYAAMKRINDHVGPR